MNNLYRAFIKASELLLSISLITVILKIKSNPLRILSSRYLNFLITLNLSPRCISPFSQLTNAIKS